MLTTADGKVEAVRCLSIIATNQPPNGGGFGYIRVTEDGTATATDGFTAARVESAFTGVPEGKTLYLVPAKKWQNAPRGIEIDLDANIVSGRKTSGDTSWVQKITWRDDVSYVDIERVLDCDPAIRISAFAAVNVFMTAEALKPLAASFEGQQLSKFEPHGAKMHRLDLPQIGFRLVIADIIDNDEVRLPVLGNAKDTMNTILTHLLAVPPDGDADLVAAIKLAGEKAQEEARKAEQKAKKAKKGKVAP